MSRALVDLIFTRQCGSAARKAILLAMADRANDDGSDVWVSKTRIAAETEWARSTVITTMQQLERDGLITVVAKRKGNHGYTLIYKMSVSKISALPTAWGKCRDPDTLDDTLGEPEPEAEQVSVQQTLKVRQVSARRTVKAAQVSESTLSSVRPADMNQSFIEPDDDSAGVRARRAEVEVLDLTDGVMSDNADGLTDLTDLLSKTSPPCDEADLKRGIEKVARWLRRNGQKASSFRYFTAAVIEARDRRLKPAEEAEDGEPRSRSRSDELDRVLARLRASR